MSKYEVELLFGNDNHRDGIRYFPNIDGTILDNDLHMHVDEKIKISEDTYNNFLEKVISYEWNRHQRDDVRANSYAFIYYKGELKKVCVIDEIGNITKYDADTFFELFYNLDKETVNSGRKDFTIRAVDNCRKSIKNSLSFGILWLILIGWFKEELDKYMVNGGTNNQVLALFLLSLIIINMFGESTVFAAILYDHYKHYKKRLLEEETNEENKTLIKKNAFRYAKDVLSGKI